MPPLASRLTLRACLLAMVLALAASASASAAPRILAGSTVRIIDHPYQVQVNRGPFTCGG